uniref:Putative ovule protein n=1 Tax=Solanum chacoense TaxID=4108 RepID=A0A0V0GVP8_SOLCH
MTKNPTFHSRTKHIDIRYHFIRDLVAKKEILLEYCKTQTSWQMYLPRLYLKRNFAISEDYLVSVVLNQEGMLKSDSKQSRNTYIRMFG